MIRGSLKARLIIISMVGPNFVICVNLVYLQMHEMSHGTWVM